MITLDVPRSPRSAPESEENREIVRWRDLIQEAFDRINGQKISHDDLIDVTSDQHHPKLHASDHSDGGIDEIIVENLATVEIDTRKVFQPDGLGSADFDALDADEVDFDDTACLLGVSDVQAAIDALCNLIINAGSLPIQFSFFSDSNDYVEKGGNTFEVVGNIEFAGTGISTPTEFTIIASRSGSSGSSEVRLFDFTNSLQIALINYTAAGKQIHVDSSLTNLPAGQAILEVQLRKVTGDNTRIHFVKLSA